MNKQSFSMNKLAEYFREKLKLNEPLKNHTTLQIGGPATAFLEVTSEQELIQAINLAVQEKINYLVIGGGSNLLVADKGFPGLVIKNSLSGIIQKDGLTTVKSGTPLQQLVNFSVEKGLGGIENLTGIPGTVGGAVFGNAGAFGQQISDHLVKIDCFNPQSGNRVTLSKTDCGLDYRTSTFKRNNFIILEVSFQLAPGDGSVLRQQSAEILTKRLTRYPQGLKCPGSFFKNIPIDNLAKNTLQLIPAEKVTFGKLPAGYLLESIGAKGSVLGQIQVSLDHGNLFLNLGKGTAKDFWQLARNLAQKVKDRYGIILQPEVQLINLPPLMDHF